MLESSLSLWFWLGAALVVGVLVTLGRRRSANLRAEESPYTNESPHSADLQLLQETVESLIRSLKSASDEAVQEVERRQCALQSLLDRVDERLGAHPVAFPDERSVPAGRVDPTAFPRPGDAARSLEIGDARALGLGDPAGALREGAPDSPLPAGEPDLRQVFRWAAEGMGEAEIARRTGLSRGEVHLMLGLQAARR